MVRRKRTSVDDTKSKPSVAEVKTEPEEGMESNGHQGEAASIFETISESQGDFVMKEEPASPQTRQTRPRRKSTQQSRPRRKSQQPIREEIQEPMREEPGCSGSGLRRSGRKRKSVVPFEESMETSSSSSSRPVKKQVETWQPKEGEDFVTWISQGELGEPWDGPSDKKTAEKQTESPEKEPARKSKHHGRKREDLGNEGEERFRREILRKLQFVPIEKGLKYIEQELGWKLEEVTGWKGELFMKQKMRQVEELQKKNKFEEGLYICNDVLSKLCVALHPEVLLCKAACLKKIGQVSEAFSIWENLYEKNEKKYGADCGFYTLTVYQEMCMAAALLDTQGKPEPWQKCMNLLNQMLDPELNKNTIKMSLFQTVKKLIKNQYKNKANEIYDFIVAYFIQSNNIDFKTLIEKSNCLFEFGKPDEAFDILMSLQMNNVDYNMSNCPAFAEMFHVACKLRKYGKTEALEKWSEFMKTQAGDPDTDQMVTLTIASDIKKQNGVTHKHDNVLMFDMVISSVGETIAKTDPKTLRNIRKLLQS